MKLIYFGLGFLTSLLFCVSLVLHFFKKRGGISDLKAGKETTASACERLVAEYAEATNGQYSEVQRMNHAMQWFKKLDEHVRLNEKHYAAINDKDDEAYSGNVTSIFPKPTGKDK